MTKLFIGSLNSAITDVLLWEAFGTYGRVTEAKVLNKNPAKLCGFVTFAEQREAESAILHMHDSAHPSLSADGKSLVVRYADPKGVKTLASGMQLATCRHGEIYIGNLPSNANDEYLKGMLAMVSTQVMSLKIHKTASGAPCGFVTFSTVEEGERLVAALHDIPNGAAQGKTLNVRWASRGGAADEEEAGETYGGASASGAVAPVDLPEKVFFGGLPHHINETELMAMCGACGAVRSVRLLKKEAKPTTALVQYTSQWEAESAIQAFHDYKAFDEKPLVVKFAEPLRNPLAKPKREYGY